MIVLISFVRVLMMKELKGKKSKEFVAFELKKRVIAGRQQLFLSWAEDFFQQEYVSRLDFVGVLRVEHDEMGKGKVVYLREEGHSVVVVVVVVVVAAAVVVVVVVVLVEKVAEQDVVKLKSLLKFVRMSFHRVNLLSSVRFFEFQ